MILKIASIILYLVSSAPNRELYKNENKRMEMAADFVDAGKKYDVDPVLLLTWGFKESSLRTNVIGKLGETGIGQSHGTAKRLCRKKGLDLHSQRSQIFCIGLLIDAGRKECKTLHKSLLWYASGKCEGTPKAKRILKRRLRIAGRLRSL